MMCITVSLSSFLSAQSVVDTHLILAELNWIACPEKLLWPSQHMPVNHLQSQEVPMKSFLLCNFFLITVLWIHWSLSCFQCPFLSVTSLERHRSGLLQPKRQSEALWGGIRCVQSQLVGGGTGIWTQAGLPPQSMFFGLHVSSPDSSFSVCSLILLQWFSGQYSLHFCIDLVDQVDLFTHGVGMLLNLRQGALWLWDPRDLPLSSEINIINLIHLVFSFCCWKWPLMNLG